MLSESIDFRNILDSEHWRVAQVPEVFQKIVDACEATGRLRDVPAVEGTDDATVPLPYLMVGQERYFVVGYGELFASTLAFAIKTDG